MTHVFMRHNVYTDNIHTHFSFTPARYHEKSWTKCNHTTTCTHTHEPSHTHTNCRTHPHACIHPPSICPNQRASPKPPHTGQTCFPQPPPCQGLLVLPTPLCLSVTPNATPSTTDIAPDTSPTYYTHRSLTALTCRSRKVTNIGTP
jgi:hypothetical protein